MTKVINCECGVTLRGETDDELLDRTMQHVREQHPDMLSSVTREQLLAMAEEDGTQKDDDEDEDDEEKEQA